MPQSLVKNYIHLVISTKHRQPLLNTTIQPKLFSYLGGICNHLDCKPVQIGFHFDHVHLLFLLSKKLPLVKLVEDVKSHSSKWIKTKGITYKDFYWQSGYGASSVNPTEVDVVTDYIKINKHII